MSNNEYLKPLQVARLLVRTPQTLGKWRRKGQGPPFVKLPSGAILYPSKGVEEFMSPNKETSMKLIMNSAMMPQPGHYSYRIISQEDASAWLKANPAAQSFVGYQQTADHIEQISGVKIAVSRKATKFDPGDEALVVRLAYRVDPTRKGEPMPEEWEYGLVRYER